MILDFTKDPNEAIRYQVVDLATGEELNALYVDTEKGICRHWKFGIRGFREMPYIANIVQTNGRIGIWDRQKLMYVD